MLDRIHSLQILEELSYRPPGWLLERVDAWIKTYFYAHNFVFGLSPAILISLDTAAK